MMKRYIVPVGFFLVMLISMSACKKKSGIEKRGTAFDISSSSIAVTIPVNSTLGSETHFVFVKHRLNIDSLLKTVNSTYSRANLRSMTLRYCVLATQNETVLNHLGNFSAFKVSAIAADKSVFPLAELPEHKDSAVVSLNIPKTTGKELAALFVNDTLTYQVSGKLRRALSKPLETDVTFVYDFYVSE